jgi:hypothetical protein
MGILAKPASAENAAELIAAVQDYLGRTAAGEAPHLVLEAANASEGGLAMMLRGPVSHLDEREQKTSFFFFSFQGVAHVLSSKCTETARAERP